MSFIRSQMQDGVAVLTYDNPDGFNAFTADALGEIHAAFRHHLGDPDTRAIVFTGTGRAFCTGADVKAMHAAAQGGTGPSFILGAIEQLHPLMRAISESGTPVIAAVNGVAAGGGLGLALAADLRIGTPASRFAAGYFGIGMPPDGGSTWFLPRLIGPQRTRRFFFENKVLDADIALDWGLLDEVVEDEDGALLERAITVAREWGQWSQHSRTATKRLLVAQSATDLTTQLELERGFMAAGGGTPDFVEGVAAFVEKRKARFA